MVLRPFREARLTCTFTSFTGPEFLCAGVLSFSLELFSLFCFRFLLCYSAAFYRSLSLLKLASSLPPRSSKAKRSNRKSWRVFLHQSSFLRVCKAHGLELSRWCRSFHLADDDNERPNKQAMSEKRFCIETRHTLVQLHTVKYTPICLAKHAFRHPNTSNRKILNTDLANGQFN